MSTILAGVGSPLDEVAERLAQAPLKSRRIKDRRVTGPTGAGPIARTTRGVIALGWAATVCLRLRRLPDEETTHRLYEQATNVDSDRVIADIALIRDRLAWLARVPRGRQGDALIVAASRRLTGWVAADRPPDARMSTVEAAFVPIEHFFEVGEVQDTDTVVAMVDSYVQAWQDLVRQTE